MHLSVSVCLPISYNRTQRVDYKVAVTAH